MGSVTLLANRYDCPNRGKPGAGLRHDQGLGLPPRAKCSGCGGRLVTGRGRWGVFVWTGDGNYPAEAAAATYVRGGAAQDHADKLNVAADPGGWVVRWIPEGA